jgi:hypothetical protein
MHSTYIKSIKSNNYSYRGRYDIKVPLSLLKNKSIKFAFVKGKYELSRRSLMG